MIRTELVLPLVEAGGLLVVGWDVWRRIRDRSWPRLLALFLGGWLAEEMAMGLYGWYGYAPGWSLWLHRTPLAVALIWPLVVLSSVEVVERARSWRLAPVWPRGRAALVAGLLVCYDALVIEPVATRVGLWWWRGGSYFGVPLLGVAGWGIFGGVSAAVLGRGVPRARAVVVLGPLVALGTHALLAPPVLLALRLHLTVPVATSTHAWAIGLLGLALCPVAVGLRPHVDVRFRDLAVKVAGSALFFIVIYALRLQPFAICCSSVPLPYLFLTLCRDRAAASSPPDEAVREKKRWSRFAP